MIAVIDYDTGNLCSLGNAISRLGADYIITDDINTIRAASKVILPGVGEASTAMQKLSEKGLDRVVGELTAPVLGICIGLQLMCSWSEEGDTGCLGIFPNRVLRLRPSAQFIESGKGNLKIPHMGWNRIDSLKTNLFKNIESGTYQYFVHSYAPEIAENERYAIAVTEHGDSFASALNLRNFYGTQFHPEKSGAQGELIIKNFLEL